jgi:hypothetical protein
LPGDWTIEKEFGPGKCYTTIKHGENVQMVLQMTVQMQNNELVIETSDVDGTIKALLVGGKVFGPIAAIIQRMPAVRAVSGLITTARMQNGTEVLEQSTDGLGVANLQAMVIFPNGKGVLSESGSSRRVNGLAQCTMYSHESVEVATGVTWDITVKSAAQEKECGQFVMEATSTSDRNVCGVRTCTVTERYKWEVSADGTQKETVERLTDNPHLLKVVAGQKPEVHGTQIENGEIATDRQGKSTTKEWATEPPNTENEEPQLHIYHAKKPVGPGNLPALSGTDLVLGYPPDDTCLPYPPLPHFVAPADALLTAFLEKADLMLSGSAYSMISSSAREVGEPPMAEIANAVWAGLPVAVPVGQALERVAGLKTKMDLPREIVHYNLTELIPKDYRAVVEMMKRIPERLENYAVGLPCIPHIDPMTGQYYGCK